MSGVQPMVAMGGSVVIWVATAAVTRRRRRRGDETAQSVSGPALATLWAAWFGSRYGLVEVAEHSATFRAHFGDLAATWLDVQDAIGPYLVVTAAITLVSRVVALLVPRRAGVGPVVPGGQVPVVD